MARKDIPVISLDGEIWEDTPRELEEQMIEKGITSETPFVLDVNSPGGAVFAGWKIFSMLKEHKAHVTTRVSGLAASIASVIVLAGDTVEMNKLALFMIHKASVGAGGNADDLRSTAEVLDKIDSMLKTLYSARTGIPEIEVEELIKNETWYTSDEAEAAGFVDVVINDVEAEKIAALLTKVSNTNSLKLMKSKSKFDKFLNNFKKEFLNSEENITAEEMTETVEAQEEVAEEIEAPKNVEVPEETIQELITMLEGLLAGVEETEEEAEAQAKKLEDLEAKIEKVEEQLPDEAKIAESVEDAIVEKLENVISFGQAPRANGGSLGTLAGKGKKIDQKSFVKNAMKEIGEKTRVS